MKLLSLIQKYRRQFIKYVLAGFSCALINWTLFYILNFHIHIHYLAAASFAFILSTTINYFLSKLVFESRGRSKAIEYIFVLAASSIALLIDLSAMYILVEFLSLPKMPSKILGTGTAFFFNYASRQFFIFSPNPGKDTNND
jgi:putative flippase GtrA